MAAVKRDTVWYNDLCILYQRTKALGLDKASADLRNILWDQIRSFVHGRVYDFIHEKKASILRKDPDLCSKLYQESFFVFLKACDIWDQERKTKFMTFLGDIINQEILNIIRMDLYYRTRDRKLAIKLSNEHKVERENETTGEENFEKDELFEEVHFILENFAFGDELERDIVFTTLYGRMGDWAKLQKKSGLSLSVFYRMRAQTIQKLREHILSCCSDKMKDVLKEVLAEK